MLPKTLTIIVPLLLSSLVRLPKSFNNAFAITSSLPKFTFLPGLPSSSSYKSSSYVSSSFIEPSYTPDIFLCDVYGPYSYPANDDQVVFTYQFFDLTSQNIIERMRLFNSSNNVIYASNKEKKTYNRGDRNVVSFSLPLKDYYSQDGLKISFEILDNSTREILKTYSSSFYPPSNAFIQGSSLKINKYTSRSLGFYGENNELKPLIETFDFTVFGEYLNVDKYYRLEINKAYFLYPNKHVFTYDYAYLYFNDDERLFPYYTHQNNGDILIPIKLVRNGNVISFAFNRSFYVNKRTLQISDVYRSGFMATKDFYLPVNGRHKFNGKKIYFDLNSMGLDKISTSISLNYDASHSIVGLATDGDYYVIGGGK